MKFSTYFVLRGDNEHLARGELRALLEVFEAPLELECYPMLCLSKCTEEVARKLVSRSGYVKEAGRVLDVLDAYSESLATDLRRLVGTSAHVSVFKSSLSERYVKTVLERAGLGTKTGKIAESRLIFTGGIALAGVKIAEANSRSSLERFRSLPFKRSISLTPDIARALVNLTRARAGEVLLDPFAGTGVVLVEAWFMGLRGLAVDIDWELVRGMKENFQALSVQAVPVLGDSTRLVFTEVDRVATDLPYGRGASTHGFSIRELYSLFTRRLSEYLSKRGYAAFMTPLWMEEEVDEMLVNSGLRLVGRYYDYVHGSLTRVVNVVVKK